MRSVLLLLAWLLVGSACNKSLDELGTFPCAENLLCPRGYSCIQGACTPVVLDGPCDLSQDYDQQVVPPIDVCQGALGAQGAHCLVTDASTQTGVCTTECENDGGCPAGHRCSSPAGGMCLVDPAQQPCPAGTSSAMTDSGDLCVPDSAPHGGDACSRSRAFSDPSLACKLYAGGSGLTCAHSLCVPECGSGATCDPGELCKDFGDPQGSGCFPQCSAESPCGSGQSCLTNDAIDVCVGHAQRPNQYEPCDANDPSAPCAIGRCNNIDFQRVGPRCVLPCSRDNECAPGYSCQGLDGIGFAICTPNDNGGCSTGSGSGGACAGAVALLAALCRRRRR